MTTPASLPKIAVIVGSNRRESINRKLAQALVRLAGSKFEAKFVRIDDLPMFNQDLEANLPAEVARYKNDIAGADGVLIVTPEHDRSIPAVAEKCDRLGPALLWQEHMAKQACVHHGTSQGAIGTAQQHLRSVMTGL